MYFRLFFSFTEDLCCHFIQQNDSLFCSFMMYHLCRSVLIAFLKSTKLGSQWQGISFSSLVMWVPVIDASICDPHRLGAFLLLFQQQCCSGLVVLCVTCGGHAEKLSFSALPVRGWGE